MFLSYKRQSAQLYVALHLIIHILAAAVVTELIQDAAGMMNLGVIPYFRILVMIFPMNEWIKSSSQC